MDYMKHRNKGKKVKHWQEDYQFKVGDKFYSKGEGYNEIFSSSPPNPRGSAPNSMWAQVTTFWSQPTKLEHKMYYMEYKIIKKLKFNVFKIQCSYKDYDNKNKIDNYEFTSPKAFFKWLKDNDEELISYDEYKMGLLQ
jgi:hypothetical protein